MEVSQCQGFSWASGNIGGGLQGRETGHLHTDQAPVFLGSRTPMTSSWPVSQAWLPGNSLDSRKESEFSFLTGTSGFYENLSHLLLKLLSVPLRAAIPGSLPLSEYMACALRLPISFSLPLNRNPDLSQTRSRKSISPSRLNVVCPRFQISSTSVELHTPSSSTPTLKPGALWEVARVPGEGVSQALS